MLLALALCACHAEVPAGTSDPPDPGKITHTSADTDTEVSSEETFVPDYLPGEEITCSGRTDDPWSGALAAQQGKWLYYGVADGKGGWNNNSHIYAVVKIPLGGTADDRIVLMTQNDLHAEFNLSCMGCGQDTTAYGTVKRLIGTLGDWIYMIIDQHILRLRTDGKVMESVLCLKPDSQTENKYFMIRDNMLYYLSEERRPIAASQTEDTWTIRKLDLVAGETRDVGAVPVSVEMAGWCGNDVILLDEKFLDHSNAYVLGADDSLTYCPEWTFTYDKDHLASFRIIPGISGEDMLVAGKLISATLDGVYRMSKRDLMDFADTDYYLPKSGETQVNGYWFPVYDTSPFSDFVLPGTEKFDDTQYGCSVDGGFCFASSGLYYYSEKDGTLLKLNDDEATNLLWPGDGYLYYVCTVKQGGGYFKGVYRIRTDGTGWEDVSWMVDPASAKK